MIVKSLSDNNEEKDTTFTVHIRDSDGESIEVTGDEVAEVVTMPGNLVQVINMDGERQEPVTGRIVYARGDWKVWVKQGDSVRPYYNVQHIQQNSEGGAVTSPDRKSVVGCQIRRVKRTELLTNE